MKIFVISLPRTGTKSLCSMLVRLGYNVKHVPGAGFATYVRRDIDAFADTPVYNPSVFQQFVKKGNKFIYINKDVKAWVRSFEKVGLQHSYAEMLAIDDENMGAARLCDKKALQELFANQAYNRTHAMRRFKEHQRIVMDLVPPGEILFYSFEQGWKPLCDFLGKSVPDTEIPHLNKNTMFDKIE